MKPKSPEDIAKQFEVGKAPYTLYLDVKSMEYIRQRATKAGTSTSKIVNEALLAYIHTIKTKKNE